MGKGFTARVKKMILNSEIILEVLDARFPEETRDPTLEQLIKEKNKPLILVLNKSDLIPEKLAKKHLTKLKKTSPTVLFSAKERKGSRALRTELGKAAKKLKTKKDETTNACIIGYPNTGKSSIINLLKGKNVAGTSPKAGYTRGEKLIRLTEQLMLIDTPGVIPYDEHDELQLALLAAKNPDQLTDPESVAEHILALVAEQNPNALKNNYSIQNNISSEKALESIAIKKGKMEKGGIPNTNATAKIVIKDWQRGKLSQFANN